MNVSSIALQPSLREHIVLGGVGRAPRSASRVRVTRARKELCGVFTITTDVAGTNIPCFISAS